VPTTKEDTLEAAVAAAHVDFRPPARHGGGGGGGRSDGDTSPAPSATLGKVLALEELLVVSLEAALEVSLEVTLAEANARTAEKRLAARLAW
jgi:hypothetical protein